MTEEVSGRVIFGDNLEVLQSFPDGSVNLIYIDPPFNTGHQQTRTQIRVEKDREGDRVGFQGKRYASTVIGTKAFSDQFDDFLSFINPRLEDPLLSY
ncbi:MAG: hypothetical protein P8046_05750 [Anaerolineales bacterium]